ncbi:MAG: hypothetical protein LBJ64_05210 [Deltaproteobacteria bacterium]|jgi:hypothetical protein|nr:hypothetical protein [Deltaproteobacteria bacterium]
MMGDFRQHGIVLRKHHRSLLRVNDSENLALLADSKSIPKQRLGHLRSKRKWSLLGSPKSLTNRLFDLTILLDIMLQ